MKRSRGETSWRSVLLIGCLSALVLCACGGDGGTSAPDTAPSASATALAGAVTVSGKRFLRDGQPWIPNGLTSVAFNATPKTRGGLFLAAYQHMDADELNAIKAWGADTVRFMVAQPALDPQNATFYDAAFLGEVETAVSEARAAGLNVIVTVQDEGGTGEPSPMSLPTAATGRVWNRLAGAFAHDTGILFEIMNEPQPAPTVANWQSWASAMNAMIAIIRATGASNVLLADGLGFAETLTGAPALDDPLGQVAYADHPYPHSAADQTPSGWDGKFGDFAASATAPVIVTEWSDENELDDVFAYCDADTPRAALNFLAYLKTRKIGLIALGYDLPNQPAVPRDGRVMVDFDGTPSTLANGASCHDAGFGPGKVVQRYFRSGNVPARLE